MTVEEYLSGNLTANGLFQEEAAGVMAFLVSSSGPTYESLVRTLHKEAEAYPEQVMQTSVLLVWKAATDWIDENCPQLWARSIFSQGRET